ncbi:MAG: AtpZ/AtpI family protein [bacterium]|nr:AtpZ/AtpI family protein [bacterium]
MEEKQEDKQEEKQEDGQQRRRAVFAHVTIGIELAVSILAGVFGGHWLDLRYDMAPLFLSIGALLGMIVGFYRLMKELKVENEKEKQGRNKKPVKWM